MGKKTETTGKSLEEITRKLLDGKKPFKICLHQTNQRDHYHIFEGATCSDDAKTWAKAEVAKGRTIFVLNPVEMLKPPAETPVEEVQLNF